MLESIWFNFITNLNTWTMAAKSVQQLSMGWATEGLEFKSQQGQGS